MVKEHHIIKLREKRGWSTQEAMAQFFGVNQSTIHRLQKTGTNGKGALGAAVVRELKAEGLLAESA